MRTRVKFCGLTRSQDVQAAVAAGVDALGFVFYPPSPRSVTVAQAQALIACVPAFVSVVALMVNPSAQAMSEVLSLPVDAVQFHGDETPKDCAQLASLGNKPVRWFKAIQIKPELDVLKLALSYQKAGACALLLDGFDPSQPSLKGGTGATLDWQAVAEMIAALPLPAILAGGLTADNLAQAINQAKPFAVDVSGGIEAQDAHGVPKKGIKDAKKMLAFMAQNMRLATHLVGAEPVVHTPCWR